MPKRKAPQPPPKPEVDDDEEEDDEEDEEEDEPINFDPAEQTPSVQCVRTPQSPV